MTVGSMSDQYFQDIEECLPEAQKKWMGALEHYLGRPFKSMSVSAAPPPSGALVTNEESAKQPRFENAIRHLAHLAHVENFRFFTLEVRQERVMCRGAHQSATSMGSLARERG